MKLPFEFGIKLFFRIILPGFFLTLGFLPLIYAIVVKLGGWTDKYSIAPVIGIVILMGWLVVILDMHIYMLFEGRRYWPKFLYRFFISREERRLKTIKEKVRKFEYSDRNKYFEASNELRKFPVDIVSGDSKVLYPSRLGNLIAAHEGYPLSRYGMDSVFYWYRIWPKLEKDLREEIDSYQSIADSTVYTSFVLSINGILLIIYVFICKLWGHYVTDLPNIPNIYLLSSILCFAASRALYRASINVYGPYGEFFKAIFDIYRTKIDDEMKEALQEVIEITGDRSVLDYSRRERFRIVWRYLDIYRIRCFECKKNFLPSEIKQHNSKIHKTLDTTKSL